MKPILFNTEMVRAILDERKTVTRRVVKPQPATAHIRQNSNCEWGWSFWEDSDIHIFRPPYQPGDILYVRETWAHPSEAEIVNQGAPTDMYVYKADESLLPCAYDRWRPSIHMPREAARIFLRVTNVRMERLHEINEEQARAEGALPFCLSTDGPDTPDSERTWQEVGPALPNYIRVWDATINPKYREKYGWAANPWVWVIKFERCEKPEED